MNKQEKPLTLSEEQLEVVTGGMGSAISSARYTWTPGPHTQPEPSEEATFSYFRSIGGTPEMNDVREKLDRQTGVAVPDSVAFKIAHPLAR